MLLPFPMEISWLYRFWSITYSLEDFFFNCVCENCLTSVDAQFSRPIILHFLRDYIIYTSVPCVESIPKDSWLYKMKRMVLLYLLWSFLGLFMENHAYKNILPKHAAWTRRRKSDWIVGREPCWMFLKMFNASWKMSRVFS